MLFRGINVIGKPRLFYIPNKIYLNIFLNYFYLTYLVILVHNLHKIIHIFILSSAIFTCKWQSIRLAGMTGFLLLILKEFCKWITSNGSEQSNSLDSLVNNDHHNPAPLKLRHYGAIQMYYYYYYYYNVTLPLSHRDMP